MFVDRAVHPAASGYRHSSQLAGPGDVCVTQAEGYVRLSHHLYDVTRSRRLLGADANGVFRTLLRCVSVPAFSAQIGTQER